jgi:hypothetical protein
MTNDGYIPKFKLSPVYLWVLILCGLFLNYLAGFAQIDKEGLKNNHILIQYFFLDSLRMVYQYIFYMAITIHILEAIYAIFYLIKLSKKKWKNNLSTIFLWAIQTVLLGGGSLTVMFKQTNNNNNTDSQKKYD